MPACARAIACVSEKNMLLVNASFPSKRFEH